MSSSLVSSDHMNGGLADEFGVRHPRIRILHAGEVAGAGTCADVVEQIVVPLKHFRTTHLGSFSIEKIAEGNRLRRARVLAGGFHGIDRDTERFVRNRNIGRKFSGFENLLLLATLLADDGIL